MMGVSIALDDFGTGAANYETFFELPFDELKIDRLFVSNLAKSQKAKAIGKAFVRSTAPSQRTEEQSIAGRKLGPTRGNGEP